MSSTEPSLQDLKNGALSVFQAEANLDTQPDPKGFLAAILTATAGLAKLCIKYGQGLWRNTFVHLADNAALVSIAKEYGIFLRQPLSTQITAKIIAEGATRLPAGTVLQHTTGQFITQAVSDFANNEATVKATAKAPGRNDSIKADDPLTVMQLLAANQHAIVLSVDYVGQNQETYNELRDRLLTIIRNLGPAGSQPYYIRNTLLQDGVREAFVYRGENVAQVSIYPIMANRQLPTAEEKTRLLTALSSRDIAFIGDYIQIAEFKIVKIIVYIRNLSRAALPESMRPRITAAVKEYVESRRPVQHSLENANESYISTLDIYAIISGVGGQMANVQISADGQNVDIYPLKAPTSDNYGIQPEIATLVEVRYD